MARRLWILALTVCLGPPAAHAQIDPVQRELIQLGYNQALEGSAPVSGYAFFYDNQPNFPATNMTLRLAIAPVYLDSELGFSHLLGENTDVGLGIAGGGFADSYYEVNQGKYLPEQSFTGDGATVSGSIYHLFDPGRLIPLNGVFRVEGHYADYIRNDDTDPNFFIPGDQNFVNVRTGLRFGGMEPLLTPDVAMELSLWYEGSYRPNHGRYGFPTNGLPGDREVNLFSHLFWGRALFAYTLPELKHNFMLSFTAGNSLDADRFSAYRLGGFLPLASEFPLTLPGYFYQELSARRFALLNANYRFPLDSKGRIAINAVGSSAIVDYLPGLSQPNQWNSGVGGGISYLSPNGAWQVLLDYGYGFNAVRTHGVGAQSIGILIQYNLVRSKAAYYNPADNNFMLRGLDSFLHSFD